MNRITITTALTAALILVVSIFGTPALSAEPFSVDLSIYEGKDEVTQDFTQTLPNGETIPATVHIYQSRENGRECMVSETESEILYVKSCVDLEKGRAVSTRIEERGYDEAEYTITYTSDSVTVEERTKGDKVREKTYDNNRVLDGYILTLLLSAFDYEELDNNPKKFKFLDHKDPNLISITLELIDSREPYEVEDETVEAVHYRTKVNNFVISLFAKPNHFYYGRRDKAPVMLEYEGSDPSSIRKRIRYKLSDESYFETLDVF
ncbi:MAG: hypothetical protein ACLFQW_05520 [Spirochaetaceae bacterium]